MTQDEKQAVEKVINDLWAHDPWQWGNTCSQLINREIDFDAPAIVTVKGEYTAAVVTMVDGREFEIGYQAGGWYMGYIKSGNPHSTPKGNHD